MKNPYRLRWNPRFFVRAIIFGVVFLAFQLVLNYLKRDKIMEYDMVFWNSFWTLAITYCAYVAQIIYSDFKELNPDKACNGKYIAHRITKYFTPIALTKCIEERGCRRGIVRFHTNTSTGGNAILLQWIVWRICKCLCVTCCKRIVCLQKQDRYESCSEDLFARD